MAGNSGGPWGGGGSGGDRGGGDRGSGGDRGRDDNRGGRRPGEGSQIPEIEQIMKKGQEHLRLLMGGRGGGGTGGGGRGPGGTGPLFSLRNIALAIGALAVLWVWVSVYTVQPDQRSVKIFLGRFNGIGEPGLNFAPWPVETAQVISVTSERTTDVGNGQAGSGDNGLMLTNDQNIVHIHFQVVWNISSPEHYLFNLADPPGTVRAVAESAMRDIIARTDMAPILNKDRGAIAAALMTSVQKTLDSYGAGVNVIRVNFDSADPPKEVIDSFRQVQASQQERDRLGKQADAYAATALGAAHGQAAQIEQEAEGYRAKVVNIAHGEASRFLSIYQQYVTAPEVTRERMYLDAMAGVLGQVNKVILDDVQGKAGSGVLPYLPLDRLMPRGTPPKASNPGGASGSTLNHANATGGN